MDSNANQPSANLNIEYEKADSDASRSRSFCKSIEEGMYKKTKTKESADINNKHDYLFSKDIYA